MTEEYQAALEGDNSSYGATSSVPKLPPESPSPVPPNPTPPPLAPDPTSEVISMTPTASMEVRTEGEEGVVQVTVERSDSSHGVGEDETQQLILDRAGHGQQ
ncbi:hypothetical protein GBAR_LOCUS25089 [Geodia barretti]|nr:hypothetical protein GBAR_LOCUS25089 [Geodia barretti]